MNTRRQNGFTLIELMVVILVIALLAVMVFRMVAAVGKGNDKAATRATLEKVGHALEEFKAQYGKYPPVPSYGSSQPMAYEFPNRNSRGWGDNPEATARKFLDYELMVYFCEGEQSEKIDWFKVINIAGLKLTPQEMRNAVYSGPWVADAKRYFSKSGCVAQKIGSPYLTGNADRQEYLETAIEWIINSSKDKAIEEYMAIHQGDGEATELWLHFQKVINWIETLFTKYRREMKGLEWGRLYSEYSARSYNPKELEAGVSALMADKEVQNNRGIYEYLLSDGARKEKLNLRQFDDEEKRAAYEAQKGTCPRCGQHFEIEEMEGDHVVPWSKGGKTVPENLQMLCRRCNALKGDK